MSKFKPGDKVYTKDLMLEAEVIRYIERGENSTRKTYLVELVNTKAPGTDPSMDKRIARMIDEDKLIPFNDESVVRPAAEKPEFKFAAGAKVVSKTVDGYVWGTVLSIPQADDPASKYLVRYVLPSAYPESPAYMDVLVPQSMLIDGSSIICIGKVQGALPPEDFSVSKKGFSTDKLVVDELKADKLKVGKPDPKFKVGDRVVWNKKSTNKGTKGVITAVGNNGKNPRMYGVKYRHQHLKAGEWRHLFVHEDYLDLATEELTKPRFKKGDSVGFYAGEHRGRTGLIDGVLSTNFENSYVVKVKINGNSYYYDCDENDLYPTYFKEKEKVEETKSLDDINRAIEELKKIPEQLAKNPEVKKMFDLFRKIGKM